jgi:spore coat polysaccharide biosynthesis protein SpsF
MKWVPIKRDLPVICIIQARMKSTRLPGKVLKKIGDKTALGLMVERLRGIKAREIIVATSSDVSNNPIRYQCQQNIKVKCYSGDENNVIKRVIDCAKKWKLPDDGIIVDLTADCPLIDYKVVNYLINKIKSYNFDYVHNDVIERSWPDGIDCQVYKYALLKEVYEKITDPVHYAHVGWNIYKYGGKKVRSFVWRAPDDMYFPELGLTLDEEADYVFLKNIYDHFTSYKYPQPFSVKTVIRILKRCPEMITNFGVKRKVPGNG